MDVQQLFGQRLADLLDEKNISQGAFADAIGCSRQSINFYILGKRTPDIVLAAKMADYLGVSCDYLIGASNFRTDKEAHFTIDQIGMTEDAMKVFAGLKILADGKAAQEHDACKRLGLDVSYNMQHSQKSLELLNAMIAHEQFGVLLQYIQRYWMLCHGQEDWSILKGLVLELEGPETGKAYGTPQECAALMQSFCKYIISNYFDGLVQDLIK